MADAIIHMDGVRSPVLVKGGEGPRGVAGPTSSVSVEDLPIFFIPIEDFNDGAENTATINAAFVANGPGEYRLPPGTILISEPITLLDHCLLRGAGRLATTIKAAAGFAYTGGVNNALIFANGKVGANVSDLTVDGDKVGWTIGGGFGVRCNGIWYRNSTDFVVERVGVQNCSGYSYWPSGTGTGSNRTKRGTFRDCWSFNANVHFEQLRAEDITHINCHVRDGDGDIPCEGHFHPLVLCTGISFIGCTSLSDGAGLLVVSSGGPMSEIIVDSCRFVSQNFYAIILEDNAQPENLITGIKLSNSYFETMNAEGGFLTTSGPGAPIFADNCTFKATSATGNVVGVGLFRAAGSRLSNCEIIAASTFATAGASGIINGDSVGGGNEPIFFDGRITATPGSGGVAGAIGSPGNVVVSRSTTLSPGPRQNVAAEDWGSVLSGNGGTGIAAITLGVTCIDEDKAHLDLSLKKGSALGNEWSYNWTVLEGTGFVTVYTEGLPNGETLRWHYVETV